MSFSIPPGMTLGEVLKVLHPEPTPDPEPDIEVQDGVARRPKVQRRKTAAEAED